MPESVFPTPSPNYPIWRANRVMELDDINEPITFTGDKHLFKVTTAGTTGSSEPVWNTATGGTTTSGSAVFTEIGIKRVGPRPTSYFKVPLDWDSITIKTVYEDKSYDTITTADEPPQRYHLNYVDKSESDAKVLDDFVETVGLDTPFTFIEPRDIPWVQGEEGDTVTGCYIEEYVFPTSRDRLKRNNREVRIIKFTS